MKTTLATMQKHGGKSIGLGKNGNEPVFYYFGDLLPEQNCDDVLHNMRHTGWFCDDDDCDDKARGIVVTLPARPGFPDGVFLAGYRWEENGERVIWPECYSDADDCARDSDHYTERFADDQREHNRKWREAVNLEEKIERKETRLRECLALRNHPCFKDLRAQISELIEVIRDTRETLRTDYAGVL